MSTTGKVILGIVSFLPVVFGLLFLVQYLMLISHMVVDIQTMGDPIAAQQYMFSHIFSPVMLFYMCSSLLLHLGLLIFYLVHVSKMKFKSDGEKVMWILLFIFIGTIAFLVYFFMRVVPDKKGDATPQVI